MNRAFHRISILLVILILPASLAAQAQKSADTTAHQPAAASPSGEKVWSDLMAGNRRYVEGKPKPRAIVQLRHSLAQGQHPKAVILTCSDSRVSPELLFDQTLGDLFVVRSAGNIADAIGRGS